MATQLAPRFCRLCGEELGINEKLGGATEHVRCGANGVRRVVGSEPGTGAMPAPPYARPDGGQPTARPFDGGSARYKGALFASNVLRVFGWIVAVATPIIAIAASASETELFGESDATTGIQAALLLGIWVVGWLEAASILAVAYVVLLLSDIEFSTRAR